MDITTTIFDLSNRGLTVIPDYVFHLAELTYLNLDNNQLTVIPEEIDKLVKLTYLDLNNNPLVYPPKTITGTEDIVEYCRLHPDTISAKGRYKNMWNVNRLIHLGHFDKTSSIFSILPIEMILKIQRFVLSDPYVPV